MAGSSSGQTGALGPWQGTVSSPRQAARSAMSFAAKAMKKSPTPAEIAGERRDQMRAAGAVEKANA